MSAWLCKRKCPRCRGNNLLLSEHEVMDRTVEVAAGICDPRDGSLDAGSGPLNVSGYCHDCGHDWTLKRVINIEDICTPISESEAT